MTTYVMSEDEINLVTNAYLDASGDWRYTKAGGAKRIVMESSTMYIEHAVSGAADAVITWVRDMTSTSNGQLSVGENPSLTYNLITQVRDVDRNVSVGGIISSSGAYNAGNVGAGEDNLFSNTSWSITLAGNGDSFVYEFWGVTANNANTKTLRLKLGLTGNMTLFSRVMTPSAANVWHVRGTLHRLTQTTQKAITVIHDGAVNDIQLVENLDQDLSVSLNFRLTAEAVADNDIVLKGYKIKYDPGD